MGDRLFVNTDEAWTMDGPWSQGVRVGPLVFTSGQVPVNPDTRTVVDGDVRAQVQQSMSNVSAILRAVNATLADIVKVTVYLLDYKDFPAMNEAYRQFFNRNFPARTCITARELPVIGDRQVRVIIDAVAVVRSAAELVT